MADHQSAGEMPASGARSLVVAAARGGSAGSGGGTASVVTCSIASTAAGRGEVRRRVGVRLSVAALLAAGLPARPRAADEGFAWPVPRPGRPLVPIGMISASAMAGPRGCVGRLGG